MNDVKGYMEAHELAAHEDADLIEEFSDELAKMTGKCIDIGCGPASVTRKLLMPRLPPNVHIIGADISKEMVEFAKQTHSDEKRLSFIELDAEAEKIPKELICAFDNAVSFFCLHWCQNTRRAFENIYQILRPGGRALVLYVAYHKIFDCYLRIAQMSQYKPYMTEVTKFIPKFQHCDSPTVQMKKILEETGFKVLHCSLRKKTYIFRNLEIAKKHFVAANPFISKMPENVGKEFGNVLAREFASKKNKELNEEEEVLDLHHLLIIYLEKPEREK
ncbi:juvenile hormone acid O-methyltransferase-like [Copidosoma floridanum]|uniref:juvenile hormone acid O-methyltransferase-like n=1 Tax=Copidosoma floridanum TaxID=29053 RepID=UPI000C6FA487|nr:juvenile hormone acid O-methyltransferase-like [Copidosoma floridanum]